MYIAMSHDPCLSGPFRSGIFDDAPSLFTQPATRASRPVFFQLVGEWKLSIHDPIQYLPSLPFRDEA